MGSLSKIIKVKPGFSPFFPQPMLGYPFLLTSQVGNFSVPTNWKPKRRPPDRSWPRGAGSGARLRRGRGALGPWGSMRRRRGAGRVFASERDLKRSGDSNGSDVSRSSFLAPGFHEPQRQQPRKGHPWLHVLWGPPKCLVESPHVHIVPTREPLSHGKAMAHPEVTNCWDPLWYHGYLPTPAS